MPLILVLGKQRQAKLSEFKTSLVYRKSSRTTKGTEKVYIEGSGAGNKKKKKKKI